MARTHRIDSFFKVSERGSTLSREVRGGIVNKADLSIIKVWTPGSKKDEFIFTIRVDNAGPASATNVVVADLLLWSVGATVHQLSGPDWLSGPLRGIPLINAYSKYRMALLPLASERAVPRSLQLLGHVHWRGRTRRRDLQWRRRRLRRHAG